MKQYFGDYLIKFRYHSSPITLISYEHFHKYLLLHNDIKIYSVWHPYISFLGLQRNF